MTTTTKNTNSTLALPAIVLATLITGVAARQGHTRNVEVEHLSVSMSLSSTEQGTAAKTNGIGEGADVTTAGVDMEPIAEALDTGVINVNDGQISLIDVKEMDIEDIIESIIMQVSGSTNIDEKLKESVMTDMPSQKHLAEMKLEKKCHVFRLVLGNSKFHGLFDAFLDKICPPVMTTSTSSTTSSGTDTTTTTSTSTSSTTSSCTPADTSGIQNNSVGVGGCCGENADCANNGNIGTGPGFNECIDNKCVCNEAGGNTFGQCCTEASSTDGANRCASGFYCSDQGPDSNGNPRLLCFPSPAPSPI